MNTEIERKYLILRPKLEDIEEYLVDIWQIIQTYLNSKPDEERRVRRKVINNGKEKFVYTVKRKITDITREENEFQISSKEYRKLLEEQDTDLKPIKKIRYRFNYNGQLFEMDFYSFSTDFATLEIELDSEDTEIVLPPFIKFVKEVTTDKKYKNKYLAKSQTLN